MPMSALSLILLAGLAASPASSAPSVPSAAQIERGRYLSVIGSCNDCHTPGYAPSGGKVPEAQWMTGDALGFAGPWGTTYPSNLRLRLGGMSVDEFKAYARALKTRPPMPYWALNTMSDADLEALWAFVRSLGPAGAPAPTALPPGHEAAGPVVRFPMPPPAQ